MALTTFGTTAFTQSGNSEWNLSGWDLDALTVPMTGAYSALSSYLSGLTQWSAAGEDGNMFLSGWSVDQHKQYPTVRLKYIGKRGGTLPPTRHTSGNQVQTAKHEGVPPNFEILYQSPTNTTTDISRAPNAYSPAVLADVTKMQVLYVRGDGGSRIVLIPSINPGYWYLNLFTPVQYLIPRSDELVPGQYYQNTQTSAITLFPAYYFL